MVKFAAAHFCQITAAKKRAGERTDNRFLGHTRAIADYRAELIGIGSKRSRNPDGGERA